MAKSEGFEFIDETGNSHVIPENTHEYIAHKVNGFDKRSEEHKNYYFKKFKDKSIERFGDKFIFTEEGFHHEFVKTNLIFQCKEHGLVKQSKVSFYHSKYGCKLCNEKARKIIFFNNYKNKIKDILKDKYKLIYNDYFPQKITYRDVLTNKKFSINKDEFIILLSKIKIENNKDLQVPVGLKKLKELFKEKHKNRFDYSNINNKTLRHISDYVYVTCKDHGKFRVKITNHITKKHGGCRKCAFKDTRGVNFRKIFLDLHTGIYYSEFDLVELYGANKRININKGLKYPFKNLIKC